MEEKIIDKTTMTNLYRCDILFVFIADKFIICVYNIEKF